MAEGEWRDVILLTLRETPTKPKKGRESEWKEGEGYGDWVVARVKPDNTLFGVTFRSGKYYPSKLDGSKTLPKDGISYYSFMELKKPSKTRLGAVRACACGAERIPTVWEDVLALLDPKNPPVLPAPNAEPPAPPAPEVEKMPWE